ncbi:unnamed protein product [Spirodela intermedia]|uniref:PUM-HD domain-containing protein n=1 Tax=Spirodela intermedia TaxID=51605 RepID=A0A7I8J491_SPIIN|nr:unnamed protein product [Spirodela intermedia]CAA6665047.1 unnamed protein product [Spirodela intermedia]
MLSDQETSASLMPQTHCYLTSNWLRPCRWQQDSPSSRSNGRCSESINLFNEQSREDFGLDSNRYQTAKQVDESLFSHGRTDGIKEFMGSEKNRTYSVEHFDESTRPILPPTMVPSSLSAISMQPHRSELSSNGHSLLSLSPVASPQRISAITCEDSFIIQGKLRYLTGKKGCGLQRERKAPHRDGRLSRVEPHYLPSVMPKYQSLSDIQGFVNLVARDQQGCRFLQHKFDEGTRQEREIIFCEIIDHIAELMVNPFGNYLVQKVLDVCTEDQRLEIILVLTKNPTDLVRISLNMHGTRAVQRLIETLKNKKQIALVISALQPGFLSLIRDPNGNHVIQRCLQYFSSEDSKFIFEAAARHCVDIATHRHGCCVLQRCIAHSTGQHQAKLLAEVSRNGLMLAQDAYGNYAVQYVLDMRDPAAVNGLKSSFEGSYVELSTQKFSSNVVEKSPLRPFFDHLLQDPYANYVIQSALLTSKGQARNSLVEAIRAHEGVLRTSPYCKRIFNLLKK